MRETSDDARHVLLYVDEAGHSAESERILKLQTRTVWVAERETHRELRNTGRTTEVDHYRPRTRDMPEATLRRALRFYDSVALLLPRRLREEDLGDYLEVVDRLLRDGAPPWTIYLKMATTTLFLLSNALHELLRGFPGRKRS